LKIEKEINQTLSEYMAIVIELSRLDKTSKCYFNLYKTSKQLLDLLNCEKMYEIFYLSPAFKKIVNKTNYFSSKFNHNNNNNTTLQKTHLSRLKTYDTLKKSISFDDEEDENQAKKSDENKENSSSNQNNNLKKKQQTQKKDFEMQDAAEDELDFLAAKLQNNTLDSPINTSSTSKFKIPRATSVFSNPFLSRTDIEKLPILQQEIENKKSNLFIYGDAPTKFDRAVFLAIQDFRGKSKYPLLNEWYDFMRSCDKSEMQKWRTPMAKQAPKSVFANYI
jgi:hypothetical protein